MKILGKNYEINFIEPNEFSDTSLMGRCDVKLGKIYLNSLMPEDIIQETLLHEVIHVIDHCLGIGLTEQQVTSLSAGLFATFKFEERK